jgi:hypothetical protein
MHFKRTMPLVFALIALAVSACGGDQESPSAQGSETPANRVDSVVQSFAGALADGRAERVCALLTASAQRAMAGGHGSCEEGASTLSRNVGPRGRQLWRELKVQGVDRSGDRAMVPAEKITPRGAPLFDGDVKLRRVSGDWLVDV